MCEMRLSLMLQQTLYRSRPPVTKGIALTKQVAKHSRGNANDATNVSAPGGGGQRLWHEGHDWRREVIFQRNELRKAGGRFFGNLNCQAEG